MKKNFCALLSVVMVVCMLLTLTACNGKGSKEKETLICGVTDFEPMNYIDIGTGEWTGFDTEFARLVAEKLSMDVKFVEIIWENKYFELESGAITCIWNGLTANTTEEIGAVEKNRSDWYDFSYSYMYNTQCVVVKADRYDEFNTADDLSGKKVAVETNSAGESAAANVIEGGTLLTASSQVDTFREVKSGAVDCAVVDFLLAQQLIGSGDYADLKIAAVEFDSELEVYAIGFKKGNNLRDRINAAILELDAEGKLLELAQKYKIADSLYVDKNFKG